MYLKKNYAERAKTKTHDGQNIFWKKLDWTKNKVNL